MDAQQVQDLLRTKIGWRIGPHTARYILARLGQEPSGPFPVIAADARTGRAIRELFDPSLLRDLAPSGDARR